MAKDMGARGRMKVEADHAPEAVARQFPALYRRLFLPGGRVIPAGFERMFYVRSGADAMSRRIRLSLPCAPGSQLQPPWGGYLL